MCDTLSIKTYDKNGTQNSTVIFNKEREILRIIAEPFENTKKIAENSQELIPCFTDKRTLSHSSTREKARENNERYLVVTNLIHHVNSKTWETHLLVQERSQNKKVDPWMVSSSAHGVAKDLYWEWNHKIQHIDTIALINTAIETTEELRHGIWEKPFNIEIVHENDVKKLKSYFLNNKIDDSDTMYIMPVWLIDSAYPLETTDNNRYRAICMSYIYSSEVPHISIDPSEVESVKRIKPTHITLQDKLSLDLFESLNYVYNQVINNNNFRVELIRKLLNSMFK